MIYVQFYKQLFIYWLLTLHYWSLFSIKCCQMVILIVSKKFWPSTLKEYLMCPKIFLNYLLSKLILTLQTSIYTSFCCPQISPLFTFALFIEEKKDNWIKIKVGVGFYGAHSSSTSIAKAIFHSKKLKKLRVKFRLTLLILKCR